MSHVSQIQLVLMCAGTSWRGVVQCNQIKSEVEKILPPFPPRSSYEVIYVSLLCPIFPPPPPLKYMQCTPEVNTCRYSEHLFPLVREVSIGNKWFIRCWIWSLRNRMTLILIMLTKFLPNKPHSLSRKDDKTSLFHVKIFFHQSLMNYTHAVHKPSLLFQVLMCNPCLVSKFEPSWWEWWSL